MRESFDTVYPSHGLFPVKADIIDGLITGAEQIRDGKIAGIKSDDRPADIYDAGVAKFLYNNSTE
jgi:hypothetical protein